MMQILFNLKYEKKMKELNQHPVIHEQAVAWGDMDAFGHVNNVLYYRYIESARIKYMDILDFCSRGVYRCCLKSVQIFKTRILSRYT